MIGAAKINFISKFTSTAVAEVIRKKKGIIATGNVAVSTAQSKFGGSSAAFDGTSDYLEIANSTDWNLGTSTTWTIEAWQYLTLTPGAWRGIMGSSSQGTNNGWGIYINDSNKLVWIPVGSGAANAVTSTAFTQATWQHWAIVRNGSSLKIYLQGTEVYSNTSYPGYTDGAGSLFIGQSANIAGGWNGYLNFPAGYMDEIRISKTARYTTGFTPSTTAFANDDNTVLLIHADGTSGTTFFEDDNGVRSPKGLTANSSVQVSTTQSKFGGTSAYFNGGYITTPMQSDLTISGNYTIEGWLYATTVDSTYRNIYSQSDGGANYLSFTYQTSNGWGCEWAHTGGVYGFNRTGSSPLNTWRHWAFVKNGSTAALYIDGTLMGTTFSAPNDGKVLSNPINIGRWGGGGGAWAGYMDEFRVSNTARYTSNFTPPTAPFVNDNNTLLLIHGDGTNGQTVFRDDNGSRNQKAIQAVGNAQIDTAQSKFGGSSALFDGTGDYLTTGASSVDSGLALTGNYWTVEYWARINAHAGAYQCTVGIWDAVSPNGSVYYFSTNGYNATNKMAFEYVYGTNSTSGAVLFGSALSTGVWKHHAYVRNGNTLTAYLDGVSQGTHDMTGRTIDITGYGSSSNTTMALTIGAMTGASGAYNGWLDEVRISNTARYTSNFTPSTTPFQNDENTLLLLHMDGTDGSTVFFDDNGRTTTP